MLPKLNLSQIKRLNKFETVIKVLRLAISGEYSLLCLKPVKYHIGFWFDDERSVQERQWMVL